MKEWIGKKANISVEIVTEEGGVKGSEVLFYKGTVKDVTDTHLTFVDKYGLTFTYRLSEVKGINNKSFKDKNEEDKEDEME